MRPSTAIAAAILLCIIAMVPGVNVTHAKTVAGDAAGCRREAGASGASLSMASNLNVGTFSDAAQSAGGLRVPLCQPAWKISPSSDPGDASGSVLRGLSVISDSDIWAAGVYWVGGSAEPLIERWDGSVWHTVTTPTFYQGQLASISALGASDAWATGDFDNGATYQPLTLHWDGTSWTQVSITAPGVFGTLHSVLALATDNVWTVGSWDGGSSQGGTLIEHWNGTQWSVVTGAGGNTTGSSLFGLAATSSSNIWAVGSESNGGDRALIERWDGSAWSRTATPDLGAYSRLYSVTAISDNDAWTVGDGETGAITLHWDGTRWNPVPVPVGLTNASLFSVSAGSAGDVWAVGNYGTFPGIHNLVLHLDAGAWVQAYTPNISSENNSLNGVSVETNGNAWAVGTFDQVSSRPLVERYSAGDCCAFDLADVQPTDYFYEAVRYLFCQNAISGYEDGTFRPYNNTTRGQLSKIIVLAERWPLYAPANPSFSDVPRDNPFYTYVETAYQHSAISGYADGTFRPYNDVTRGQLAKIIVLAQGWAIVTPIEPTFTDVPSNNTFYSFIETAFRHNIISGYSDGTFRPNNDATRGQISKIVFYAVTQP